LTQIKLFNGRDFSLIFNLDQDQRGLRSVA
jgi:hypothetical protein